MPAPKTLFEKVWDQHIVVHEQGSPAVLYVDLHLVHEVTSPQAFAGLERRGLDVRRPDRTVATMDHSTPTRPEEFERLDAAGAAQLNQLEKNCRRHDIRLYSWGAEEQGIVHVIGPELGLTQPGMTIVCGDSHTSTHGALGALAFGIGTSEVEHVLATQCLLQPQPSTFEIRVDGRLPFGVTAKDLILALISELGVDAGTGHVFEYCGEAIRSLDMESRMTICNMSIEAGARAGMIAPDETTFEYVAGRRFAPQGQDWDRAVARWRELPSDKNAQFDRSFSLDASRLAPMITYGTNPGMGTSIEDAVPRPSAMPSAEQRDALERALDYMDLTPGQRLQGQPIDVVFIGSCTNARLSDLRQAASIMEGEKVANGVRMLVVPGSQSVRRQAESEGLDEVFRAAGAEWRHAGCSMCLAMNNDRLQPGQYAVSTTNRNFQGRQGPGGRTFLASPLTAAASAIAGAISDPRPLLARRQAA
ncbi:MAG: 3-isopropylmalate dehydratase large subunit [Anaerolineales bacterium]|nr:3-isopropylmalate dehydratase large subunit [Anaerolineales bacterium]